MDLRRYQWLFAISFVLWVSVTLALSLSWGQVPALGPLLSPFHGLWQNYPRASVQESSFQGLKEHVSIYRDQYGIPHIVAQNDEDLYWAQGYLVASERLFQMDMQTRAAAGRLSELMGKKTRPVDKMFVSLGLRKAASGALAELMKDPLTKTALLSYTAGVNAFIKEIKSEKAPLPAEYKLLGHVPEKWEPIRTAYLLKIMSFRLNGHSQDLKLTSYLKKFGKEKVEDLFPDRFYNDVPVVPDFKVSKEPVKIPEKAQNFVSELDEWPEYLKPYVGNGSNNWAVSGQKSQTGHSLVANDTHLKYGLPSTFYELQLTTPKHNVYGATFPGTPGVIIGFNKDVAWAVTNAYSDVLDWYEVEFKDASLSEYRMGEQWYPSQKETQRILVKGEEPVDVTLVWTRLGIVVHSEKNKALVLRWVSHRPSNELLSFLNLNRATNHKECLEAISNYMAPAQNFICADQDNISIHHNGLYPKKWKGQGKYVLNGSDPKQNWVGWIDHANIPHVTNPKQGYVLSANQRPVGRDYPFYLGWEHTESYRSQRIQEFLEEREKVSPKDLIDLQNDNQNLHAKAILPVLLTAVELQSSDNELIKASYQALSKWDFSESHDQVGPALFHTWWNELERAIWEDDLGEPESALYPKAPKTTNLLLQGLNNELNESEAQWLGESSDEGVQQLTRKIVNQSFRSAVERVSEQNGSSFSEWKWGEVRPTELPHFAAIPGLGLSPMSLSGSAHSVNVNRGVHGPTWKMVVELGPNLQAWTNYPGGPSGNPFDPDYTKFVTSWAQGELRPVEFWQKGDEVETSRYTDKQLLKATKEGLE